MAAGLPWRRGKSCPMLSDVVFNYGRVFIPCTTACPAYFKRQLGTTWDNSFLCVDGTSLEGGIGRLTDFIKKLSHVVRCCLQLRAGFHPMHDCVPQRILKDNLGQLGTTFFLCVDGTSLEGGIGRLTDFIKSCPMLSDVVFNYGRVFIPCTTACPA